MTSEAIGMVPNMEDIGSDVFFPEAGNTKEEPIDLEEFRPLVTPRPDGRSQNIGDGSNTFVPVAANSEVEIIDLDELPDMVNLPATGLRVPQGDGIARIGQKYNAESILPVMKACKAKSKLRQQFEDIARNVETGEKKYFYHRSKKVWLPMLRQAEKTFREELKVRENEREKLDRDEDYTEFSRGILKRAKRRVAVIEQALSTHHKIFKDLTDFYEDV